MNNKKAWYKKYIDDSYVAGHVSQTNPITGEIWFESDLSLDKGGFADWVPVDRITYKEPENG